MEKIVTIDGRQVRLKSTGAFLLRYKAQFQRDALKDIYKMESAIGKDGSVGNIEALDLEPFFNIIWVLAKTADPNIAPPEEWLDTFSEFPIIDIIPEVMDMVISCITSHVDSKKK